jgi:hypothetical protein
MFFTVGYTHSLSISVLGSSRRRDFNGCVFRVGTPCVLCVPSVYVRENIIRVCVRRDGMKCDPAASFVSGRAC